MLFSLGPAGFPQKLIAESKAAEELAATPPQNGDLCQLGVDYVYSGTMGDFSGTPINTAGLAALPGTTKVYDQGGVLIFKICGD